MTRLNNPPYPFLPASLPTPNFPHDHRLITKAAFDKLKHIHSILPLSTRPPTPPLEQAIIEQRVLDIGRELDPRRAVRLPFQELNGERENGRHVVSPAGEEHAVPGTV